MIDGSTSLQSYTIASQIENQGRVKLCTNSADSGLWHCNIQLEGQKVAEYSKEQLDALG